MCPACPCRKIRKKMLPKVHLSASFCKTQRLTCILITCGLTDPSPSKCSLASFMLALWKDMFRRASRKCLSSQPHVIVETHLLFAWGSLVLSQPHSRPQPEIQMGRHHPCMLQLPAGLTAVSCAITMRQSVPILLQASRIASLSH